VKGFPEASSSFDGRRGSGDQVYFDTRDPNGWVGALWLPSMVTMSPATVTRIDAVGRAWRRSFHTSGADRSTAPACVVHRAVTEFRPGRRGTVAWNDEPRVETFAPELLPLTESVLSWHLPVPLTRSDHAKASPPRMVNPMTGFTEGA
jgi:hypothetical protein